MMGATILVVDDDPPITSMLAMLLEDEGYAVQTARDGDAALAAIERGPPDLIVSDVMMPGIGGIVLAMRSWERGIPVILMSAAVRRCDLPDVPLLPKPFDLDHFLSLVDRALTA